MSKTQSRKSEIERLGPILSGFPGILVWLKTLGEDVERESSPTIAEACKQFRIALGPGKKRAEPFGFLESHGQERKGAWSTWHFGPQEQVATVKAGLPTDMVLILSCILDEPRDTIARLSNISPTTLHRRLMSGSLRQDEGERVLRLTRVVEAASRLFDGDQAAARRWLNTPLEVFNNTSPLEFSDTEPGALFVEKVIGRLEHGVFT